MAEYKEYIVTLKKKEDLDKFYEDMELLGGDGDTPDREVSCAKKRPISRNTHYFLTDEEAESLRSDDRVKAVELLPTLRGITPREHYEQTSDNWDKSQTIASSHKNWGLIRCVEGVQTVGWGYDGTPNRSGTINVTSSGKNVDVVIVDGGHFDPTHPEYAVNSDGTGGSRVIQYNWFQHNPEVLGTEAGVYDYSSLSNHSAHVAGTVAGNTQGWARGANIYNISFNTDSVFDFVRAFHNSKPVNPETGIKNPTIVNNSWGSNYDYADGDPYDLTINYRGTGYPNPTEQEKDDTGFWTNSYLNGLPARVAATDTDVEEAVLDGIIMIGSAGNSGMKMDVSGGVDYNNFWELRNLGILLISDYYHRGSSPGSADGMICVGSSYHLSTEYKSYFSNCGPRVDIFAPGSYITSSVNDDLEYPLNADDPRDSNYKISKISGTSMSSPQVCGLLACVLEQYPNYNQSEILEYVTHYAKDNQLSETSGGYQDPFDLQNSNNLFLYYYKERPDNGMTYPKLNKDIRPTEGICYPRPRIKITKGE